MLRLVLLLIAFATGGTYILRQLARTRQERIAQVRAAFLVTIPTPRGRELVVKDVALRNGAVRLRIPKHWAEEYRDEDRAAFWDPVNPERVFRIESTVIAPASGALGVLLAAHAGVEPNTVCDLAEGQALLKCLTTARERDQDVVLFRWIVGASLPPSGVRVVGFQLACPVAAAADPLTQDAVAQLELEIRSIRLGAP